MAKKKYISINIEYDGTHYWNDYDKVVNSVAKKWKAKEVGTGMGFGVRDMNFDVPEESVKAFIKECRKLKHVIKVSERED